MIFRKTFLAVLLTSALTAAASAAPELPQPNTITPEKFVFLGGWLPLRPADHGATWTCFSTIASDSGGALGAFREPGIVRTKSARIIAGLRNAGPDQAVFTTCSDDGKRRHPPQKSPMHGHPVDLMQPAAGAC